MINQISKPFANNVRLFAQKKIILQPSLSTAFLPICSWESCVKQQCTSFVRWNSEVVGQRNSTPVDDAVISKNLDVVIHSTSTNTSLTSPNAAKDEVQLNSSTSTNTAVSTRVPKLTALEKLKRLDEILPKVSQSFNLATFVNRSPVLQQFVKLGVNVSEYDKDVEKASYVLLLDFETDVKPHLFFLYHLGVPPERWARILTKNPYILKEDLDVLTTRVQYLRSKKFSQNDIATLASYPNWLSNSIESIDTKLAFIQKMFDLNGDEVRAVATRLPRIVFSDQMTIMDVYHLLSDEYAFTKAQLKRLFLNNPRFFHLCKYQTRAKMKLLIDKMMIPVDMVVKFNKVLTCRLHVLDNRHYFLKSLERAQYDPKLPRFVSLDALAVLPDELFATTVAKSTLEAYRCFQKTL
ncbi:Transcription termination factor mitochondrial/chloroplastic [Trinorchestia longiramus]|nr:Transcription termination factor mitochondrial/chloroplastic [Trinorchestia longiramus]